MGEAGGVEEVRAVLASAGGPRPVRGNQSFIRRLCRRVGYERDYEIRVYRIKNLVA